MAKGEVGSYIDKCPGVLVCRRSVCGGEEQPGEDSWKALCHSSIGCAITALVQSAENNKMPGPTVQIHAVRTKTASLCTTPPVEKGGIVVSRGSMLATCSVSRSSQRNRGA